MHTVAVDIGGTHARFAFAAMRGGAIILGEVTTLLTRDHASFVSAWNEFARRNGGSLPEAAAIAVAGPAEAEEIRFTNNPWVIRTADLASMLGIRRHLVINDFAAVAHAVAHCGQEYFEHLSGPDEPLPAVGTISVVGPGTGLGVAQLWRAEGGTYRVQGTEGGHSAFAPHDRFDDALLARLRQRHGRVSVERVVAGPAIVEIYRTLAAIEGRAVPPIDDKAIWERAIGRTNDDLATAAAKRFCLSLGAVAGDIALTHGARGVVIAGGLGLRIKNLLQQSEFAERFCAKGRFHAEIAAMPVKLLVHPQPGLLGAAAAYRR